MTVDPEVRLENVFRKRWRDRHSSGARPGALISQPAWIDVGLAALGLQLVAGAAAAMAVTVAHTTVLPAVVQGTSVTAIRAAGEAPAQGAAVQFRDTSGATFDAVVIDVTATEVMAQLGQPDTSSAGELLVPAGRQRLISVLMPRLE